MRVIVVLEKERSSGNSVISAGEKEKRWFIVMVAKVFCGC